MKIRIFLEGSNENWISKISTIKLCLICMMVFAVSVICGGLCHEVIGHGLIGVLAGGQIKSVWSFGIQFWPQIHWVGFHQYLAACDIENIPTPLGSNLCKLSGSMSTWCVSVLAFVLLWTQQWTGLGRIILVCLSLWCLDLFLYTLPSWGIPITFLGGPTYSEPYTAAINLCIPGFYIQTLAVVMPVCLLAGAVYSYRRKVS